MSKDLGNLITDFIQSGYDDKTIQLNVDSDTCGPHNINIVFGKNREYTEDDDSDFVKKIKSFNILDSDDLVFKNGWILRKDGGCSVDNDHNRDFEYKMAYIRKRDLVTKNILRDKDTIDFIVNNDMDNNTNNEITDDLNKECDNESVSGEFSGVMYEDFISANMNINNINLINGDDIVLKSSYCNVLFSYPLFENTVVFRLVADDAIIGFSARELILKVMQRYHLLWFLCQQYDMENGTIISEDEKKERLAGWPKKNAPFRPVLYYSEWYGNGVMQLEYIKEYDQWDVIMVDYI